ncbi:MAG: hypothetical protein NZ550_03585 [Fimbriimonadales bacterium]|nr:hypothetical protein [Fimbriimonadales bacterium]MDW8051009.1 hypothetical protein [Armatimonadota bacterium]
MRLDEFKRLVEAEFGPGLRNATPANVREFLDRLQQEAWVQQRCLSTRYELPPANTCTFEEVMKQFFADVLDLPPEKAVILLWTLALELTYAAIEQQYAEVLDPLFRTAEE